MKWNIVEDTWREFRGEVKAQWGKLTDDQLDAIAGQRDQLSDTIQEVYSITQDEAEFQIRRFENINQSDRPHSYT